MVKLNLGCGNKILPGYINVDLPTGMGVVPDVVADLRFPLPFNNDYANEILAVHIIEHFYRWQVDLILSDWYRVLKPGGILIVECPNLLSACQEVVNGSINQRVTMWPLYGDPSRKDEYMIHRWGYTPDSLISLLTQNKFVNVSKELAQFKMREPRDMRVVGYKPTQ